MWIPYPVVGFKVFFAQIAQILFCLGLLPLATAGYLGALFKSDPGRWIICGTKEIVSDCLLCLCLIP
jgi:hypothetical protein